MRISVHSAYAYRSKSHSVVTANVVVSNLAIMNNVNMGSLRINPGNYNGHGWQPVLDHVLANLSTSEGDP